MVDNEAKLATAHPVFAAALRRILNGLLTAGWQPRIAELKRTQAQQAKKVKQGYSKTMKSWHVSSTIGTLPVGREHLQTIRGEAADIVDARWGWGGPAAKTDHKFWKDLGRLAKENGCSWGGDWKKFKDVAHIEFLLVEERVEDSVVV
jgi:peptidoglycan L-alanyl-D-glutamate endopeptidase CwlK